MPSKYLAPAVLLALVVTSADGAAQDRSPRPTFEGTAVVRVEDSEYTIPIICDDASRPELGFSTEPSTRGLA